MRDTGRTPARTPARMPGRRRVVSVTVVASEGRGAWLVAAVAVVPAASGVPGAGWGVSLSLAAEVLTGQLSHYYGQFMSAPLYLRIRSEWEARIRSGELPPGTRLPTEAELREQYGIGRATAQRVLHELAQAGLVERHRRRGTFVADSVRKENLLRFVNPRLTGPEIPGRHEVRHAAVVPAAQVTPPVPALDGETPVHHLVRRKFDAEETPLALEYTTVPFALAPRLLEEDLAHLTVISYFRAQQVPVATSRMYLDPVLLDAGDAELLHCEPGVPVLRQRRLTWLENGELAESAAYLMRPGLMEFYIEQSLRDE